MDGISDLEVRPSDQEGRPQIVRNCILDVRTKADCG